MKKHESYLLDADVCVLANADMPVLRKKDIRLIKVGENTYVDFDMEEAKEQMKRDIHREIGIPCLEYGA